MTPALVDVGDGVRIAVHEHGPGDGRPILLLPGLGDTAGVWDSFAHDLAGKGLRALAVDLRGHGASSWPGEGYTFEAMADDLAGLCEALRLGPAALVGHSLGGRVALELALLRPELVARLVLAEAPPARLTPVAVDLPERPDEPTPFDWAVVSPIRHQARAVDPGWWDRIGALGVPALWVLGGATSQVPQDLLADAAARMPDGRLVTVDGGHSMHTSRPEEFSAAVLPYLLE